MLVLRNGFPVSAGHTLSRAGLVLRPNAGGASGDAGGVDRGDARPRRRVRPPACNNAGINDSTDAGQTVEHCHIHLIPRYEGDVDDPRAGCGWVIPGERKLLGRVMRDPVALAENILLLLDQGAFTSTYKYEVLLGLLDACMERTSTQGEPPKTVTTRHLAEKVLAFYWPHVLPFEGTGVLRQNRGAGTQAELVRCAQTFRQRVGGTTLHQAPIQGGNGVERHRETRRSRHPIRGCDRLSSAEAV